MRVTTSTTHHCLRLCSCTTMAYKVVLLCFAIVVKRIAADDITGQVFGSYDKFMPAAFGDFNSDKHTDIFVIEKDKGSSSCYVRVLLAFLDPPLLRPEGPNCTCPGDNVKSVVPGDFDGDGALDVLMLSVQAEGYYDVYIAYGDLKTLLCPQKKVLTMRGQPLMFDYNGDMIADLFGESVNQTRSFWVFSTNREQPPMQIPMLQEPASDTPLPSLRIPSSHGFVDLDGDLASDLFVTAKNQFEIWTNNQNGFHLTETIPIPEKFKVVGQTTFMDVAMNGNSVPITVLCGEMDCSDGQIYAWTSSKVTGNNEFLSLGFPLKDSSSKSWSYPSSSHHVYPYTDTITLRVADYDLDGYPDLLLTLLDSSDTPQAVLAINRPCEDAACPYHRHLDPSWGLLTAYPGSPLATFFDVFEDGRVDILLLHPRPPTAGKVDDGVMVAAVITDTQQYDAMFLKVLVPSGRCYSECAHNSLPYGTSPAGPTFRYSIVTGDSSLQVSTATQLSQSAHMALQMPYTLFGLGRNWNFVETLEVGLPIKEMSTNYYGFFRNDSIGDISSRQIVTDVGVRPIEFPTKRNFTQIIPNSQVIVIPYPLDQPDRWVNKLYVTPSKALKLTAAALLVVCLLVAGVIAVLHVREKREDRKEKLQQAQTFHFDAM